MEPFERSLACSAKHSLYSAATMLNATLEGIVAKRRNAQQVIPALLKYLGKYNLVEEHPQMWQSIREGMGAAFLSHYKASSLARKSYIQAHRAALCALFGQVTLEKAVSAFDQKQLPPVNALQVLVNTANGCCMLNPEGVDLRYNVDERLKHLSGNKDSEEEAESFHQIGLAESNALAASGIKAFDKKGIVFSFLHHPQT